MPSTYQASSRRYRPQLFSEIKGQDLIITVLKNAILHHRTVHSYLFSGIRGTGKTSLARVFAKALNCLSPQEDAEPCNRCSVCQEIMNGSSLDFMEIDGASHRGIDDIRQINETLLFAPLTSKYKIYLIDEVHMLTKEAFNSLLKSLEEPPAHVKFFLATTEMHKIPETILSRCQKINLKRLSDQLIIEKLLTISKDVNLSVSEEALQPIARMAQGSLRDAESLYDYITSLYPKELSAHEVSEALGFTSHNQLTSLVEAILSKDYPQALLPITKLIDSGVAPITFLYDLTQFYLEILIHHQHPQSKLYSLSKRYSHNTLLEIVEFLGESAKYLQNSMFEKIFLETVVVRLIKLSHQHTTAPSTPVTASPRLSDKPKLNVSPPLPQPIPSAQKQTLPTLQYKEQSLFQDKMNQEVVFTPIQSQIQQSLENTPSKALSASLDTLLQFASVEFSGTLTKEI